MLVFFLVGYLGVAIAGEPDYLVAGILFFGAIFVSLVLMLMYHLVDTLKDRSLELTETLVGVIEARDPNLNGHSRNVQKLCMCLYEYLPAGLKAGINPVNFEYAALLHDVGKLGVPEAILNKPGPLNSEEWEIMRQHPKIAMDLLKTFPSFEEIKDWILYHHERIDGKGYYGLPMESIPMAARMIAVCDTYSAITMSRSYKAGRSHEEAIEIIRDAAGSQLDPAIVAVFVMIPKEKLVACMPEAIDLNQ
ncbi:MAG: HD domain-containing protein [Lachnospiraceae bacterium]|nr:HD domain-containing protein [Lachnospiraceae bacterium]